MKILDVISAIRNGNVIERLRECDLEVMQKYGIKGAAPKWTTMELNSTLADAIALIDTSLPIERLTQEVFSAVLHNRVDRAALSKSDECYLAFVMNAAYDPRYMLIELKYGRIILHEATQEQQDALRTHFKMYPPKLTDTFACYLIHTKCSGVETDDWNVVMWLKRQTDNGHTAEQILNAYNAETMEDYCKALDLISYAKKYKHSRGVLTSIMHNLDEEYPLRSIGMELFYRGICKFATYADAIGLVDPETRQVYQYCTLDNLANTYFSNFDALVHPDAMPNCTIKGKSAIMILMTKYDAPTYIKADSDVKLFNMIKEYREQAQI